MACERYKRLSYYDDSWFKELDAERFPLREIARRPDRTHNVCINGVWRRNLAPSPNFNPGLPMSPSQPQLETIRPEGPRRTLPRYVKRFLFLPDSVFSRCLAHVA